MSNGSSATHTAAPACIQLKEVHNSSDLDRFLKFPWRIYKRDPNWVPLLLSEQRKSLSADGLFQEHGRFQLWLAEQDGEIVGRIGAFIDDLLPEENVGNIGFFEAIEDEAVARSLFGASEKWLASKGMKTARGPLSPTLHEIVGILIEGEPGMPTIMMAYNPPYYQQLFETCGWEKGRDFVAYWIDPLTCDLSFGLGRIEELKKKGYQFRSVSKRNFEQDARRYIEHHNECYLASNHYAFAPFSEREGQHAAKGFKDVMDSDLTVVAEKDSSFAGAVFALPDANSALRKLNGRMGPVRLLRFMLALRRIDTVRVMDAVVSPHARGEKMAIAMIARVIERARQKGFQNVEASWVVEGNEPSHRTALHFGGRVARRYRVYEKTIK
jgi:GNAT superfamily N-acetyltransferase